VPQPWLRSEIGPAGARHLQRQADALVVLERGPPSVFRYASRSPIWSRHAAETLGIHEWRAGVTPADKIARIEELKRRGVKVLMAGDGMNDAPALAAAHVSMSPVSATHLSQATADLVFLGDRLAPVVAGIGFSRKALRLMRQNLWLAAGYNLIAVPLAIAGLATPLVAAAAMSGSSLLVIVNALRAHRGAREFS
jgi:Cu2+-exporting ATPase